MSTLVVGNLLGVLPSKTIKVRSGNKFYAPGSIVQATQVVKTDTWSTTSTTPVDITGMSITITPTLPNSKVLILVDLKWIMYGHADIYLLRDGNKIYYGDAYGSQTQASLHSYGNSSYAHYYGFADGNIRYMDNPATISPVTYKLQGANPYSSSYGIAVNYIYPNDNYNYASRLASSIIAMEIAQ